MDKIMGVVNYVQAHWGDIAQVILQVIGAASVIVKLTPSQKDDAILGKAIAFISKYVALNKPVVK